MKREFVVSSIGFDEQGIELAYMILPDDVRSEGHVVASRSVALSYTGPVGDLVVDLRDSAHELAEKLHGLLDTLPVYEPPASERMLLPIDEDEEDVGMGDGR